MRRVWTAIVPFLLFGAVLAGAAEENSLGLYFDPDRFETVCLEPESGAAIPLYFVLENCSQSSIGGFEFAWRIRPEPPAAPFVMDVQLPPHSLNIGSGNNFIVGFGVPLVTRGSTILATVNLMFTSLPPRRPYLVQVGPSSPSSIADRAAFNDGDDPAQLFAMNYSDAYLANEHGPGGWSDPGVGGFYCAFDDEATTWGTLKARFDR